MTTCRILSWAAWAPGLDTREQWRAWARAPQPPPLEGVPEVRFVPAMQRRRLSRLARMTMQVANELCPVEQLRDAGLVFASRHGELRTSVGLLTDIARDLPLSPTAFSHSVHNAPVGLVSIATANAQPASSIAARRGTFAAGLIETLALAERRRGRPVVLLAVDEPPPELLAHFADEACLTYAVALLVTMEAGPDELAITFAPTTGEPRDPHELPQALRFLAWWLTGGATLLLSGGPPNLHVCRAAGS